MCLALYSKKQITLLFDKHIDEYDYAIIIRPDTHLHNPIDINYFNELTNTNIIIPKLDQYMGCNDRMCIGKPNIVSYYGKLFDDLLIYSKQKSIISELYLLDKLNEKYINIIIKNIPYCNPRIQTILNHGVISPNPKPHKIPTPVTAPVTTPVPSINQITPTLDNNHQTLPKQISAIPQITHTPNQLQIQSRYRGSLSRFVFKT